MTIRNIFNRSYTSNGSQVRLINGGGTTSSYTSPYTIFAGENLIQSDVVYTSGNSVNTQRSIPTALLPVNGTIFKEKY